MEPLTAAPSYLPWDTSAGNRFAHYSKDDHSAPLWIATLLGMVYIVGILFLRIYIKRRVFGWDDYLIGASSVAAVVQSIVIYVALTSGLGQIPVKTQDLQFVGELTFSSRILCLASLYLAKLSVLAILNRIFVRDKAGPYTLCNLAFGFTIISAIASIIVSSVGCSSSRLFTGRHCNKQITRWSIVTGLDIATEAAIILLPPYMVYHLQMRIQNKLRVIAAFCFRLSVIVLSTLHLNTLISYAHGPSSPLLIVKSLVWQQVLLAVSLITATIPNLKAFLQSLSARWGEVDMKVYGNYGTGTYELKSMNSKVISKSGVKAPTARSDFESEIQTERRAKESMGSLRGGSQDLIIRKETTWSVVRN